MVPAKVNEIGVAELTPIETSRTESHLTGNQLTGRLDQWEALLINSSQQCGRNQPMQIHRPLPLATWLQTNAKTTGFLLQPQSYSLMKQQPGFDGLRVAFCAGPEGGFSDEEVELATRTGFATASIGPRTFRAETAPLIASTILQAAHGDLA